MKKFSLSKSRKALMISGVSVLAASAVIVPTAIYLSQSKPKPDWPAMVDEFDKEFGLDVNIYFDMKEEFRNKYRSQLKDMWYADEVIEEKMAELEQDLEFIDNRFKETLADDEDPNKPIDYTSLTKVLSDFARDKYNIHLSRPSNVSFDDIYDFYLGLRSSSIINMRNQGLNRMQIIERIEKSDEAYADIMSELQEKYSNDALSAWTEASTRLYDCFVADSEFAALMSAQDKLKQFLDSYNITYNTNEATPHTYDSPLVQGLVLGEPISPENMNIIFTFTEKTTNREVKFKNSMIPNFTIVPVLHARYSGNNDPDSSQYANRSADASNFSDSYTLSIDWQISSDLYIENNFSIFNSTSNATKRITAHLRGNNADLAEGKACDDPVEEINKCDIIYSKYDILASDKEVKDNLNWNFFTKQMNQTNRKREVELYDVSFVWPESTDDIHYEAFWDGVTVDRTKDVTSAEIDEQALASAGLNIRVDVVSTQGIPTVGVVTPLVDLLPHKQEYWDTPDKLLTPQQIFIKYCAIGGFVELENKPKPNDKGEYTLNLDLFVKYRNLPNENFDTSCIHLNGWSKTINAKLSDEFFTQASDNYNKTKDKYSIYFNSAVIGGLNLDFINYTFDTAIGVSFDAIACAELSVYIAYMLWKLDLYRLSLCAVCAVLITGHIGVIGAEVAVYTKYFLVPFTEYEINRIKLSLTDEYDELDAKISSDDGLFPTRYVEKETKEVDGEKVTYSKSVYDKKEFDDKKAKFLDKIAREGFVDVRDKCCEFYSGAVKFAQDPSFPADPIIKNFNKKALEYDVGPDKLIELFSLFEEGERIFDTLGYIEDVKTLIYTTLSFFLPKVEGKFKSTADKIKDINRIAKLVKTSSGLVLDKIKCSEYERIVDDYR